MNAVVDFIREETKQDITIYHFDKIHNRTWTNCKNKDTLIKIVVCIINGHYIEIKTKDYKNMTLPEVFPTNVPQVMWDVSNIKGIKNLPKQWKNDVLGLCKPVLFYVWDSEAYVNMEADNTGLFHTYACGFLQILTSGNCDVSITDGPECITEMIDQIVQEAWKQDITTVYMYAHNAKKFDNYLLLNTSFESGRHDTYKFKTVIKSGSGLIKVVLIVASKE